jgi:predicted amidohydrolase
MKTPDLKITLIQSVLHWEDKEKNLAMFSEKISSISEVTDLIILPEMFSTGFTMNAPALAETMDGSTVAWMRKTSNEKKCVITGSVIIKENGKYYNRLIWMRPDGFDYYDKRHLFSLAGEDNSYSRGYKRIVVTINGWKILPLICYDLRFPVWSRRTDAIDYDVMIYTANWPDRRVYAWKQLLIARAIENQSYVAGINRTGNDGNDIYHSGYSAMLDYKGEPIDPKGTSEEFIFTYSLIKEDLENYRKQFAFFNDRDEFEIGK